MEDEPTTSKLSEDDIRSLARSITTLIEEEAQRDNIVSMDDVEFELNYDRKIEVTDVPINFDAIRDCIEEGLTDWFEEENQEE